MALAGSLLILLLPVIGVVALIVWCDSGTPIFYRQLRVGRDRRTRSKGAMPERRRAPGLGQPFYIIKFRTMVPCAEIAGPRWADSDDPRATRAGRLLRATHLDELPQLWNVLRGHMSLVGPRPERPHFVTWLAREIPDYGLRFRIRPGVTGIAQLLNGYDQSIEDVIRKNALDLYYIDHRSLLWDVRILAVTGIVVLRELIELAVTAATRGASAAAPSGDSVAASASSLGVANPAPPGGAAIASARSTERLPMVG